MMVLLLRHFRFCCFYTYTEISLFYAWIDVQWVQIIFELFCIFKLQGNYFLCDLNEVIYSFKVFPIQQPKLNFLLNVAFWILNVEFWLIWIFWLNGEFLVKCIILG